MGYRSNAEGEIAISPPIPWAEIKGTKFATPGWSGNSYFVFQDVGEFPDPSGATTIYLRWTSDFKAYTIKEELQEIVDKWGKGRTFTGEFIIQGEGDGIESLDLWKLYVNSNEVKELHAEIHWPER